MKALFLKAPTAAHASDAQLKAGNYKKFHKRWNGLDIAIENPKGSIRSGTDGGGHKWSIKMGCAYGYIKRTEGLDSDHVDVYVGSDEDAPNVYIVTQNAPPAFKNIDEQKVMLGFNSAKAAKTAYLAQYDNPKFFREMKEMPVAEFKEKVLKTYKAPKLIKALIFLKRTSNG